jgi:hypothetical protein
MGMAATVSLLPSTIVAHHAPRREGHSRPRVLETLGQRLQGSRKQPVVTVYELDTAATGKVQTLVVVLIQSDARFIAYQAVPRPEQTSGDRDAVVRRIVVDDHDLELDTVLIQDATHTTQWRCRCTWGHRR